MSQEQELALAQINQALTSLPLHVHRQISDAINKGVPATQVLQWLNQQRTALFQRQQQQMHAMNGQPPQVVQLSPSNSMAPPNAFPETGNQVHPIGSRTNASSSSAAPGAYPVQQVPLNPAPVQSQSMNPPQAPSARFSAVSRQGFLRHLAQAMNAKGTPLPPALTGEPNPMYDASKSRFSFLEIPSVATFVMPGTGKTIDIQELFLITVQQMGGSAKLNQTHAWPLLASRLGLPEFIPGHNGERANTGMMLASYFKAMLGPMEEMFMQQQNSSRGRAPIHQPDGSMVAPGPPLPPVAMPNVVGAGGSSGVPLPVAGTPGAPAPPPGGMISGTISGALKRKFEGDYSQDLLRQPEPPDTEIPTEARRTILPRDVDQLITSPLSETKDGENRPGKDSHRYKIEYMPISRPLDTYGGRRLENIERQLAEAQAKRAVRPAEELGPVEIESLTRSLASGLGHEISYALTTLTILSLTPIARDRDPATVGIALSNCDDLLDVIVDVLEDVTFGSEEEVEEEELFEEDPWLLERPQTWTRPALLRQLGESDNLIGNAVRASKIQKYGPKQDPATVVLTILNLLMNFLGHSTNQSTLANHARLLDTLARICDVIPSQSMPSTWRPLSDELELNELLRIQSETVSFLSMLDLTGIRLANQERRTPRRFYNLFISYIIDPAVSLAPRNILPSFIPSTSPAPNVHLHGQVDTALDAFVKLSARDANRIVLARPSVIPQSLLILHFQSLAQMLPVTEEDFLATTPNFGNAPSSAFPSGLETLVSFVERVVHSLHSIAFFAPPPLKKRLRAETPGLVQILTRMAQYYIGGVRRSDGYVFGELPGPGGKGLRNNPWIIVVRRIYETLSLLDLCEDAFDPLPDTPLAFAPPSARGGGGGSGGGDSKGLLASRLSELLVTGLLRETNDDVAFRELDSLLRLGPGGGITFKDTTGIVY